MASTPGIVFHPTPGRPELADIELSIDVDDGQYRLDTRMASWDPGSDVMSCLPRLRFAGQSPLPSIKKSVDDDISGQNNSGGRECRTGHYVIT